MLGQEWVLGLAWVLVLELGLELDLVWALECGPGVGPGVSPGVSIGVGLGVGPGWVQVSALEWVLELGLVDVGPGVGAGIGPGDGLGIGPGVGPGVKPCVGTGIGPGVGTAAMLSQAPEKSTIIVTAFQIKRKLLLPQNCNGNWEKLQEMLQLKFVRSNQATSKLLVATI